MARKNSTPQIEIDTSAPVKDPGRAAYTPAEAKPRQDVDKEDANSTPRAEDRIYGVESRARWGGSNTASLSEMQADAKRIEAGETEAEEEEDETDASQLTVPQLKEALDAAKVEYSASAKKPALVALYNEHNLGG